MKLSGNYLKFESIAERIAYKKRRREALKQTYDDTRSVIVGYVIPALCIGLLVGIVLFVSSCQVAHASEINEDQAVRAIIGEASGEGLEGMRCVASAIRNRGTLKGVYGLHAKHVNKQPKWVWKLARKAWKESATQDFACGASYWEGTAFKTPYWAKDMVVVKTVKNQRFYRPKAQVKS